MRNVIESLEQVERRVEESTTTGIVVLTSARRLLYMNLQAQELCRHLLGMENDVTAKGPLPQAVADLRDEVVKHLERASHFKDWESVELSRVAGNLERPVLLRGLGLPDPLGVSPACVLILMEEANGRAETAPVQAKERFQLTTREQAAIQYLAKGCTNKEIALALGISEPTVKEHVRNIMLKTGTHTRTGILARILGP